MLGGLGIAGDLEPDVTFVEDLSDLVDDVVDDLYVRRFRPAAEPRGTAAFERAEAGAIARAAIDNPSARIVERRQRGAADAPGAGRGGPPGARGPQARAQGHDLRRPGRAAQERADRARWPAVAAQLRARFEVVLVDEFQDTDPAQWEILRLAFGGGPAHPATLVLIADPKQAIYAFRGADVYAYLEAARAAATRATLPINWRSDQGLIDAHDALLLRRQARPRGDRLPPGARRRRRTRRRG